MIEDEGELDVERRYSRESGRGIGRQNRTSDVARNKEEIDIR